MVKRVNNRWLTFLLIAVAVVVGGGIVFGLHVVWVSLEAERTHQAEMVVLESLTQYVQENSGRWPKNWDELATVSPTGRGMYRLRNDLSEIQSRVSVDFSVTAADVGAMDVEGFSVVKPIGPNYGPPEAQIRKLIEVARRESQTARPTY
jgi:hypothetical protein